MAMVISAVNVICSRREDRVSNASSASVRLFESWNSFSNFADEQGLVYVDALFGECLDRPVMVYAGPEFWCLPGGEPRQDSVCTYHGREYRGVLYEVVCIAVERHV